MPVYSVTRKSDGVEVYRYSADSPVEWSGFEFSTHDHTEVQAQPDVSEPYGGPWTITKLAFRNRFTQTEKVTIEIAALDDPAAPMQQRQLAAMLRANQLDVASAQFIDLQRPDTRAGVQALEQYGLIAAGRAAEILDTEPTETEVWRG